MQRSREVEEGLGAFYSAFNSGDTSQFEGRLSGGDGVSVIGSAPGEGHSSRQDWLGAYEAGIAEIGLTLEGGSEVAGFAEGDAGFATDQPAFVLPNGGRLRTRLTAVLGREDGEWKMVHAHFSVGVPDEEAIEMPPDPG